ncbi:MAG: O-antigen ligase family protein [Limisphaerales bacterium]
MSIRVVLCVLLTVYFSIYAWRNYFVSLCAAIASMAIMQHPDVIQNLKDIGGIQGLNLWNILMFNVFLSWLGHRRSEGLVWDMPRYIRNLLIGYLVIVVFSAVRLLLRVPYEYGFTIGDVISEDFINSIKWVVPGLILFDACRTRRRVIVALLVIIGLNLLLALQVIKHVPPSYALSDEFQHVAYKLVQNETGYNRVTLSMMLGGASWAALMLLPLGQTQRQRYMIFAAAGAIALGQALTGGRSGYVAWGAVGLILGAVYWRRILIFIPVVVVAICVFLPGVRDRMLQGIVSNGESTDAYEMTSGRNIAWPYVIDKIKEAPLFGFGREAMTTTGLFQRILDDTQQTESFPHPHNAYLQLLLDDGLVGFLLVIPFYFVVLRRGFHLLLDHADPLYEAVGGVCVAMVLSLLVAGMGGETFYPREGAVGMWAAIGMLVRLSVERERVLQEGGPLFGEPENSGEEAGADVKASPVSA